MTFDYPTRYSIRNIMKLNKDLSLKTFKMTLLAALISSPLAAETIDKTWELGVFGDCVKSSTVKEQQAYWQKIEAGKGLGLDLQKVINERWNARLELAKTRYDINNGGDTDYGTRFGVDAIYKVEDTALYFFTGVKRFNNVRSYNAANIGAGFSFEVSDRVSLFSEGVVYRDLDYGFTDQGIKVGFKYAFGEERKATIVNKAKPVKPAPVVRKEKVLDSDNDGVNDSIDRCDNTPATVKVDSTGCTLYSEKAVAIDLNVAFENNSSQIKSTIVNDIQRLADFMKAYNHTNVVIEGHSSVVGQESYNLMLSQKRADAVKAVLVNTFKVDESRISAKGFGESQLLSKGNTNEDHRLNRRVVAKIETSVKKVVTKK